MLFVLDIIKFCLPALIVGGVVYFLFKQFFQQQYNLQALDIRSKALAQAVPLRFQAYERLALLCERLSLGSMLSRIPTEGMSAGALRIGLIMTIQQEYEHNLVQQIYVSEDLWKIIQAIRDNQLGIVNKAFEGMNGNDTPQNYIANLLKISDAHGDGGVGTALHAIKEEVSLML
jgi:hypothetical protein